MAEKNPNDSSILDLHKRTLMNSDIMDELELTDDIRFDKDLKVQRENKAARTIQRWYKTKMQDRMMLEAEKAIFETRQLLKLKKERLLKNYAAVGDEAGVRDSITLVENILKESGSKNKDQTSLDYEKWHVDRPENFSLFAPASSSPTVPTASV